MLDTMTYAFMDWVAVITNLNSSDTGCLDYETVIECLPCDKKKKKNCVFHLKTSGYQKYKFKLFTQSFTQGGVPYLERQSIG